MWPTITERGPIHPEPVYLCIWSTQGQHSVKLATENFQVFEVRPEHSAVTSVSMCVFTYGEILLHLYLCHTPNRTPEFPLHIYHINFYFR